MVTLTATPSRILFSPLCNHISPVPSCDCSSSSSSARRRSKVFCRFKFVRANEGQPAVTSSFRLTVVKCWCISEVHLYSVQLGLALTDGAFFVLASGWLTPSCPLTRPRNGTSLQSDKPLILIPFESSDRVVSLPLPEH